MNSEIKNIKLVATDLDGTFLKDNRTISSDNLEALQLLGNKNILRTVATGRNLRKVKEVLNEHIPFDYVVYSSGAGVYDWRKKKHLQCRNIQKDVAEKLMLFIYKMDWSFHAFYPTPDNHKHWFYRGKVSSEEFDRYFRFNNAFATSLEKNKLPGSDICQFLIIIKEDSRQFLKMKKQIEAISDKIRVVRTSSPISKGFIWIEVFHHTVSKGNGVHEICKLHQIDPENTIGIGNDYNDLDLLNFTGYSYITENAPLEIRSKYLPAPSNEDNAFAEIIKPMFK